MAGAIVIVVVLLLIPVLVLMSGGSPRGGILGECSTATPRAQRGQRAARLDD